MRWPRAASILNSLCGFGSAILEPGMITIQPLVRLDTADHNRVVTTYLSEGVYIVRYRDSPTDTAFELHYVTLPEPAVKTYDHFDATTLHRYTHILQAGFSFGAYDGD